MIARSTTVAALVATAAAACLEAPAPAPAPAPDLAIDAASTSALAGDVVYLSFDGDEPLRYGPGLVATPSEPDAPYLVPGRFGDGLDADITTLALGDLGRGAGPPLTVEAWIYPRADGCRVILGDSTAVSPDLEFRLTTGGHVALKSGGAATPSLEATSANAISPLDRWTHVAATWDGRVATYYIDGARADDRPMAIPDWSDGPAPFVVGARADGACPARAVVDEIKLSSHIKDASEIRASMDHDPTR